MMKCFTSVVMIFISLLLLISCADKNDNLELTTFSDSSMSSDTIQSSTPIETTTPEYDVSFVDLEGKRYPSLKYFLYTDGRSLFYTSFRIAKAFMSNDTDTLMTYFVDDEERRVDQLDYMNGQGNVFSQISFIDLQFVFVQEDSYSVVYAVLFNEDDSYIYVNVQLESDGNGGWKTDYVDYSK